jgi:hypothetical protein
VTSVQRAFTQGGKKKAQKLAYFEPNKIKTIIFLQ